MKITSFDAYPFRLPPRRDGGWASPRIRLDRARLGQNRVG
jgi:hypothetical protein